MNLLERINNFCARDNARPFYRAWWFWSGLIVGFVIVPLSQLIF